MNEAESVVWQCESTDDVHANDTITLKLVQDLKEYFKVLKYQCVKKLTLL